MLKPIVTALAVLLATTPVIAQTSSSFAPAEERFGTQGLSAPAIAVLIRRMHIRVDAFPSWAPSIFGPLAATENALRDWESRYPDDPRIARDLLDIEQCYLAARGDEGLQLAISAEAWLERDYGQTAFAARGRQALDPLGAQAAAAATPVEAAPIVVAPPVALEPPLPPAPAPLGAPPPLPDAPVPLVAPPPDIAAVPVTPPLRQLDYALSVGTDGPPADGELHLDLLATHGEGAVTVDIAENIRDGDDRTIRADIGSDGTITSVLDATLSDAELALLGAFSLGAENINGVDVGDRWSRDTVVPGGHASTQYVVKKNDGDGHVVLGVTRKLTFDSGEQSSWNGDIEYDANAFAPISVAFNGNISSSADDPARLQRISLRLELQNDTFEKRTQE